MSNLLGVIEDNLSFDEIKKYCVEAIEKYYLKYPEVLEVHNYFNVISKEFKALPERLIECYDMGIKAALGIDIVQVYISRRIDSDLV